MASQPVASSSRDSSTNFIEIHSFVRGLHAYLDIWEPRIDEVLLLQQESDNSEVKLTIALLNGRRVIGHIPKNLAPIF